MGTLPTILTVLVLSFSFVTGAVAGGCTPGQVTGYKAKYRSFKTGYYPDSSEMEGGFTDRNGHPLKTLQSFLGGGASYVSVAMDHTDGRFPYGTVLRIPDVEDAFGKCIEFRVVDSGGRFTGKGSNKIDICNDNNSHANSDFSNGWSEIYVMSGGGFGSGGDDDDDDNSSRQKNTRPRGGTNGDDDDDDDGQ